MNNINFIICHHFSENIDDYIIDDCLNIGPSAVLYGSGNDTIIYVSYVNIYGNLSYAKISNIISNGVFNTTGITHEILNQNVQDFDLSLNWQILN